MCQLRRLCVVSFFHYFFFQDVITQNFFLQRKKIAGILLLVKTKKKRFVKKNGERGVSLLGVCFTYGKRLYWEERMVTFCLVFVVLFQIIFSSSFNRWNTDKKKKNDSNHTTAG